MRWPIVSSLAATVVACASAAPPTPSAAPAPPPGPPPVRTVTAVVLVNGCAVSGAENARLAQAAMNQLVDGCTGFSGDRVQFTATLLPGGAIQFEQRPGASATIPLCVLNHPLNHRVRLQKACSLDVQLEESLVPVSRPADGGV
jgi:hypothetical protein